MRKNAKIAAIVSAAALLAVGASMTAFAVTGWQEEDGTWVYYDRNGEQVTDKWEKSGDNWFYLDDSGEMATDSLIEDDDNYYYVDANGAMVKNQWIAIDNEDAGEDDQPDVWWYYFQGNGKAFKNNHSNGQIFKKQINGKTYCFDDEGKMQYGWVSYNEGTTNYDDNAYEECEYYFGDENDGAMTVGWREIALTDVTDSEGDQPGDNYWDEDQVRWFWFKSSGKKQIDKDNKTINGRKYGFDHAGRMIADWHIAEASKSEAESVRERGRKGATASDAQNLETAKISREFQYFSSPESGARYTKGWFKVVPGWYLNKGDYDDDTNRWYYADGQGKIYAGEIRSIKGKKYAFDLKGGMISGLAILKVNSRNDILEYVDDETYYYTEDDFDDFARAHCVGEDADYAVYYFSDDPDHDGTMKTGSQKVTIDGDSFTFKFEKSGTNKGQGISGYDKSSKKYYLGGKLMNAGKDDKVKILNTKTLESYTVTKFINEVAGLERTKVTAADIAAKKETGKAKEGDGVYALNGDYVYGIDEFSDYVVINTSGAVVKSGTKKDGDGIKVVVEKKGDTSYIKQFYVND